MGGATRARRDRSDARAYYSLSLYAVRRLGAVREVRPHSTRYVVFVVKKQIVLDGPRGPGRYWWLLEGVFCSEADHTASEGWEEGFCKSKLKEEGFGRVLFWVSGVRELRTGAAFRELIGEGILEATAQSFLEVGDGAGENSF